jgi:hypothetical protein
LALGENMGRRWGLRMSACPKCGFAFAWDGTRCGHCKHPSSPMLPEVDRDDLRERRILFKARRHNLPGQRTHRYHDLAPETQQELRETSGEAMRGRPVLVFYDSRMRWTLLTTREVIGLDEGLRAMSIDDMVSVGSNSHPPEGATSEEIGQWKSSWEHLRVADARGTEAIVWVPCGGQAYALWNILLWFVRRKG